ncbi:MAG: hypothetical protein GEU99_06110 [Luteitalea sp.]|nr:hypothetical protein [Luteitalea sp.]
MMRSIWMHPWDLEGARPREIVAELLDCGLNTCNLALAYHGGRMMLPHHSRRRVYEQDQSLVYYAVDRRRYGRGPLQPHVAAEASLVPPFLEACVAAGLAVNAWIVLCHNDRLGVSAPDCCIQNVFGDRYTHALCPANPHVRAYVTALCQDVAALPEVGRLDLEALSFMGYEHASLHDKRGVPLTRVVTWLLSICFCPSCRDALGSATGDLELRTRNAIELHLHAWAERDEVGLDTALPELLGLAELAQLLQTRQQALATLLDEVRAATRPKHLDLRLAASPLACGGKTALPWDALAGRVDSVTVSFFGQTPERMRSELGRLPSRAACCLKKRWRISSHSPEPSCKPSEAGRSSTDRRRCVPGEWRPLAAWIMLRS